MEHFTSVNDVDNINELLQTAGAFKEQPFSMAGMGNRYTLGLIFLNPSLRTRMSTQKAAYNLGMNVMVMNMGKEGWALETRDGIMMDGDKSEHIKEAASVIGQYCDIVGIRSFPRLKNKQEDYEEIFLREFIKYAGIPVVSLESATLHPLQSLADLLTIENYKNKPRPKVVMSWAPHVKPLPQAVPNSFAQWAAVMDYDFIIANPEGYDIDPVFRQNVPVVHDQEEALSDADFVYVKSWSAYENYGQLLPVFSDDWMITHEKLKVTQDAKVMHCLPVRRDVVIASEVLDSESSVVIEQAANRTPAAQAVLQQLLKNMG